MKIFEKMFILYLTQAGWPKGWAVFRLAKEVWNETTEAGTEWLEAVSDEDYGKLS